jgi:hypothetical protein
MRKDEVQDRCQRLRCIHAWFRRTAEFGQRHRWRRRNWQHIGRRRIERDWGHIGRQRIERNWERIGRQRIERDWGRIGRQRIERDWGRIGRQRIERDWGHIGRQRVERGWGYTNWQFEQLGRHRRRACFWRKHGRNIEFVRRRRRIERWFPSLGSWGLGRSR